MQHDLSKRRLGPEVVNAFLQPLLRERGFPILAAMVSSGDYNDEGGLSDDDFEFGLYRFLDGIEMLIERAT